MTNTTACPLDCYDACEVLYENGKLKGLASGYTQGFLCPHLNHYDKFERISAPRYKGEVISMQKALEKLKELVENTPKHQMLCYKGSGNFGLMQDVTEHFFASNDNVLTDGTLCDGAGEAGIIEGRGSNKNMPYSEIEKSDVIIFWGRNPHVTSSHLLPLIKDKKIIVVDPVKTQIAKMADYHVQLKPHTDLYFAMLLTRFLHIEGSLDEEFLREYASEFEDYYELTQAIRIKATLDTMGLSLGDIGAVLEMVQNQKVAIVCGVGIQKYSDGADVMRAIDAFAVTLGLFGKSGCGVAYLGNSKEGIDSPFNTKAKTVSKVNVSFDEFETVFIQGANPLAQMPDSQRVSNSIYHTKNVVYFGLWENETSERADLVIPAKNFLEKDDIRASYGHNVLSLMLRQVESEFGISEYELAKYLCDSFNIEIKTEQEYIEHFKSFGVMNINGAFEVENRENIPYQEGFDTDDGEFVFLDEFEVLQDSEEDELHLITPKSPKSLNSQFERDKFVYINSSHGIDEGEAIKITSVNGELALKVKINEDLRDDCVLIYSGTPGVNNLTSSKHSLEGKSAIFQETMVSIIREF
ncbi:molybdopterin-dependent oxidoreductase [Sulfurimonas sp. C5]|uniref:molybdopterin-containing oxidoreductase family protein n=1 Tax=Sulfurimonas sp. C5 TaxID=3036947 RepID=UPI002456F08D|nr:molybdopterin-dependent oxidoreductase [Sulfurimonas sp. C5]MDH4944167.1 molybdopterin-dependent oxidoreductase [Sulfurimonas sp. C5]